MYPVQIAKGNVRFDFDKHCLGCTQVGLLSRLKILLLASIIMIFILEGLTV